MQNGAFEEVPVRVGGFGGLAVLNSSTQVGPVQSDIAQIPVRPTDLDPFLVTKDAIPARRNGSINSPLVLTGLRRGERGITPLPP